MILVFEKVSLIEFGMNPYELHEAKTGIDNHNNNNTLLIYGDSFS